MMPADVVGASALHPSLRAQVQHGQSRCRAVLPLFAKAGLKVQGCSNACICVLSQNGSGPRNDRIVSFSCIVDQPETSTCSAS